MKTVFTDEIEILKNQMTSLPWENREFYISYLTQTFYFVRHSTRLLAMACAHAGLSEISLHRRFAHHIGEEKGHDLIALNDLKKMNIHQISAELPETKNLYEGQYYKIEKIHSAALFGYILALEGVASLACPLFIQRIYQTHGVEAAHFLKLHVEEDPDHVEKAFAEIDLLSPELKSVVQTNLIQSFRNYGAFLTAVHKQAQRQAHLPEKEYSFA